MTSRTIGLVPALLGLAGCWQATRLEAGDAVPDEPDLADGVEGGDCAADSDCGEGRCVRVPDRPGGYWTCAAPRRFPATVASDDPRDECRRAEDCDRGGGTCGCFGAGSAEDAFTGASGGPPFVCACDECAGDGDCGLGELCVPAGAWTHLYGPRTFGLATCRPTECAVNSDCTAGTSPLCVPYSRCGYETLLVVKVCSYAEDECRTDEDCEDGVCLAEDGRFRCTEPGLQPGCW